MENMYRRFYKTLRVVNGFLREPYTTLQVVTGFLQEPCKTVKESAKDLVTFVQLLRYGPTIVMCIQYSILLALFKDPHKLELFTKF